MPVPVDAYSKSFKNVEFLYKLIDKPTGISVVLDGDFAEGVDTITVDDGSDLVNGMDVRLGAAGRLNEYKIESGGGTETIVLTCALRRAYFDGEAVVERMARSLGLPQADGFKWSADVQEQDEFDAKSRFVYDVSTGYIDLKASTVFLNLSIDLLALWLGMPEASLYGNGTNAAASATVGPRGLITGGAELGAATNVSIVVGGYLQDGSPRRLVYENASFTPEGSLNLGRGIPTRVPMALSASSAFHDTNTMWVPATLDETYLTDEGDRFYAITFFGEFSDSGASTTLSAGVAAGVYSVPLTSISGLAANDFITIGTGVKKETHEIASFTSLVANLKSKLLNAHLTATPVKEQAVTNRVGVTGGVSLAVQSQSTSVEDESEAVYVGKRLGNAGLEVSLKLNAMTEENIAGIYNIPSTAITGGIIPLGKYIGTGAKVSCLLKGTTYNGDTVKIILNNMRRKPGGEITWTQAQMAEGPYGGKPSSMLAYIHA